MKGLLLSHIKLDGNMQMALDKFLLTKALSQSNFSIAARFYSWKGIWLSIGKNQINIPHSWKELANKQTIRIVRRPTGGDAVLHSGGLTYSLIWKNPPKSKKEAYKKASQWLINGFTEMGLPLKFGNEPAINSSGNCFSRSTAADLVDINGFKRIGSAQFWQQGNLLQHGEILLNPPQKLWVDLFNQDPPKRIALNLSIQELEKVLTKSLLLYFSEIEWHKKILNEDCLERIKAKVEN